MRLLTESHRSVPIFLVSDRGVPIIRICSKNSKKKKITRLHRLEPKSYKIALMKRTRIQYVEQYRVGKQKILKCYARIFIRPFFPPDFSTAIIRSPSVEYEKNTNIYGMCTHRFGGNYEEMDNSE